MSDSTRTAGQTLSAAFDGPHRAREALRSLREAGLPDAALRLDEDPRDAAGSRGGSVVVVRTEGLASDQVERARRILAAGGAGHAAGGDAEHAPRRVQPGFADAPPGYVPDPDYGEDLPEPRGRFEGQLDDLPDDAGRAEGGRARVTIISPKEA